MSRPEPHKPPPAPKTPGSPGPANPGKELLESILAQIQEVRSIQDLLKIASTITVLVREKLNRRITANIATPKELFQDVEKVCDAITRANRSLQTPKDKLHLSPPLLDDLRKELRQLARLTSRPEIDSRNYHNALVVMAALAIRSGIRVTLDAQQDGRAYLIIQAPTGQISFSATGGGAERLGTCLGLAPGEPTWDGHTSSDRDARIQALAESVRA